MTRKTPFPERARGFSGNWRTLLQPASGGTRLKLPCSEPFRPQPNPTEPIRTYPSQHFSMRPPTHLSDTFVPACFCQTLSCPPLALWIADERSKPIQLNPTGYHPFQPIPTGYHLSKEGNAQPSGQTTKPHIFYPLSPIFYPHLHRSCPMSFSVFHDTACPRDKVAAAPRSSWRSLPGHRRELGLGLSPPSPPRW